MRNVCLEKKDFLPAFQLLELLNNVDFVRERMRIITIQ